MTPASRVAGIAACRVAALWNPGLSAQSVDNRTRPMIVVNLGWRLT
jgi:hypothetical protein